MNPSIINVENWLTRKPQHHPMAVTFMATSFLFLLGLLVLKNAFGLQETMAASQRLVYVNHQWWRAWTSLFAHADLEHLLSNLILFIPLSYLLIGYFGIWFFPVFGLFMGGLINLLVLKTMSAETLLVGISGLVYWMGAAWLTLYLLIDKRVTLRHRFANALVLTTLLFVPETFLPQVSYVSHLFGFVTGIGSGLILFLIQRKDFWGVEIQQIESEDEAPSAVETPLN